LSVTREGKEGRGNGNKEHGERTPSNRETNKKNRSTPNRKSQKNPPSTTRTIPPLSKKDHFWFAKFLRVAIYRKIQEIAEGIRMAEAMKNADKRF
jgi:hypothetical protein